MTISKLKYGSPFDVENICSQVPDRRRFAQVRAMARLIPSKWWIAAAVVFIGAGAIAGWIRG